VVVGGRDFRDWHRGDAFERALDKINRKPSRADIELRVRPVAGGKLEIEASARLKPGVSRDDVVLAVAATQNGLASRVRAGENRGEHLRHDFVVRDFAEARVLPAPGAAGAKAAIALRAGAGGGAVSAAAFVQDARTGEVLQALAAPPCG
jgi:hypothetical protein